MSRRNANANGEMPYAARPGTKLRLDLARPSSSGSEGRGVRPTDLPDPVEGFCFQPPKIASQSTMVQPRRLTMETTAQLTPFLGASSRDGVGLRVAPEALSGAVTEHPSPATEEHLKAGHFG